MNPPSRKPNPKRYENNGAITQFQPGSLGHLSGICG